MQIIDRISDLLDILVNTKDGHSVSEISEKMQLSPSSVHRMLSSLKKIGYVAQDSDTKKYKAGLKILTLAVNLLNHYDIRTTALHHMKSLSEKYDKLVFLSVYQNGLVVCIETVELSSNMKFYVNIGSEMPLNAAAAAQAIIAFESDQVIDALLEQESYKPFTEHTIIQGSELKSKLLKVREDGYAICDRELEEGVNAISVPIRDYSGKVVASLTMTGLTSVNSLDESVIEDVIQSAGQISNDLGYSAK